MSWEGAEPVKGQYNVTYLEEVKKIVDRCAKFNITVLLDAHQDVLSRFFNYKLIIKVLLWRRVSRLGCI